jgi:hypothetical protein
MLIVVPSSAGYASGQMGTPISVGFNATLPLQIGQTPIVTATVTNISNSTVQLTFLGLRWDWNAPTFFFIGGNSEKGAVLAVGQQIIYPIPVVIPGNVTPGTYRLNAYATCRLLINGNWTGIIPGYWVVDIPLTSPAPVLGQTTSGPGLMQTSNLETTAVLAAVVAIGLYLERGRLMRVIRRSGKPPSNQATPAKSQGEREEEEV